MITYEQEMRDLMDNRVLFLRILEDNSPARCRELLAQHPEYIHMRCSVNDQVSFWLTLLFIVLCQMIFDYCCNFRI